VSHKLLGGSDQHGRNPVASPYGIAARRLTLTGGAERVGVRLPGDVGDDGGTCRIEASG